MSERKTFIFVDDHQAITAAFSVVLGGLGLKGLGSFVQAKDALEACPRLKPDLVIYDWRMPGGDGTVLPRTLSALLPATRWVLFTSVPDSYVVATALQAGTHGCISKESPIDYFTTGCRDVLAGKRYLCPAATKAMHNHSLGQDRTADLSECERRILGFIAGGLEAQTIAMRLTLEVKTVHNLISSIRRKLGGQSSMVNLARFAAEHGLGPGE